MAVMSPRAVYELARSAGLDSTAAVTATAIAIGESGLRTDAVGDEGIQTAVWGPSIGLWQIRSVKAQRGTGGSRDAAQLANAGFNARSMVEISKNGTDWTPWSVFTSGKYRDYLGQVDTSSYAGLDPYSPSDLAGDVLDAINPFANWQADALRIALTVAAVGTGLALVVFGLKRSVGS